LFDAKSTILLLYHGEKRDDYIVHLRRECGRSSVRVPVGSKLVFVASPLSNCWLGIRKISLSADCSVSELATQGVGPVQGGQYNNNIETFKHMFTIFSYGYNLILVDMSGRCLTPNQRFCFYIMARNEMIILST
jgi:hypothetical protein